jgi:hypothetical protein
MSKQKHIIQRSFMYHLKLTLGGCSATLFVILGTITHVQVYHYTYKMLDL